MIFNMVAGGGRSSGAGVAFANAGATMTANNGSETKTATELSGGVYVFPSLTPGSWTVTCVQGGVTQTRTLTAAEGTAVSVTFDMTLYVTAFDLSALGTLGTDYKVRDDAGNDIAQSQWGSTVNWNLWILKTHDVKVTRACNVDVFLLGGGGGGAGNTNNGAAVAGTGGPGYHTTKTNKALTATTYSVVVGAGGSGGSYGGSGWGGVGGNGGATTGFGESANGGTGGTPSYGGYYYAEAGAGGSSCRPFDGSVGPTLAQRASGAAANTGNGGVQVTSNAGTAGGSGVVIIRNHR